MTSPRRARSLGCARSQTIILCQVEKKRRARGAEEWQNWQQFKKKLLAEHRTVAQAVCNCYNDAKHSHSLRCRFQLNIIAFARNVSIVKACERAVQLLLRNGICKFFSTFSYTNWNFVAGHRKWLGENENFLGTFSWVDWPELCHVSVSPRSTSNFCVVCLFRTAEETKSRAIWNLINSPKKAARGEARVRLVDDAVSGGKTNWS